MGKVIEFGSNKEERCPKCGAPLQSIRADEAYIYQCDSIFDKNLRIREESHYCRSRQLDTLLARVQAVTNELEHLKDQTNSLFKETFGKNDTIVYNEEGEIVGRFNPFKCNGC